MRMTLSATKTGPMVRQLVPLALLLPSGQVEGRPPAELKLPSKLPLLLCCRACGIPNPTRCVATPVRLVTAAVAAASAQFGAQLKLKDDLKDDAHALGAVEVLTPKPLSRFPIFGGSTKPSVPTTRPPPSLIPGGGNLPLVPKT